MRNSSHRKNWRFGILLDRPDKTTAPSRLPPDDFFRPPLGSSLFSPNSRDSPHHERWVFPAGFRRRYLAPFRPLAKTTPPEVLLADIHLKPRRSFRRVRKKTLPKTAPQPREKTFLREPVSPEGRGRFSTEWKREEFLNANRSPVSVSAIFARETGESMQAFFGERGNKETKHGRH